MTSTQTIERETEMRVLETSEVDSIAGGYIFLPGGVGQMPDRSVGGCGTMWYQDRLIKILTGQTRP